jgi:hypothetical protein
MHRRTANAKCKIECAVSITQQVNSDHSRGIVVLRDDALILNTTLATLNGEDTDTHLRKIDGKDTSGHFITSF